MKAAVRLPLVRGAIALIQRDGRYLISRRPANSHLGGYWEFPGGKRRGRESGEACLRREAQEELGVRIWVGRRMASLRFAYPDRRVELAVFRAAIPDGQPAPKASARLRWVVPAQLGRLRFPPANRALIARLSTVSQRVIINT